MWCRPNTRGHPTGRVYAIGWKRDWYYPLGPWPSPGLRRRIAPVVLDDDENGSPPGVFTGKRSMAKADTLPVTDHLPVDVDTVIL